MDHLTLTLIIEGLREHMMLLAEQKGSLIDPEVVAVSQTLDKYIVKFERLKLKRSIQYSQAM